MYDDVIIGGKITTAREYTSEKGPYDRRLLYQFCLHSAVTLSSKQLPPRPIRWRAIIITLLHSSQLQLVEQ